MVHRDPKESLRGPNVPFHIFCTVSHCIPMPLPRVLTTLPRPCPAGDTFPRPQGERSFFLQPGERLQDGIQDVFVLSEDEGLLLQALQTIKDTSEVTQGAPRLTGSPGGTWEKLGVQGAWDARGNQE